MNMKKVIIQVLVAIALFIIVALVIERDFSQEMILEKTRNGFIFGLAYALYIVVREKFIKK